MSLTSGSTVSTLKKGGKPEVVQKTHVHVHVGDMVTKRRKKAKKAKGLPPPAPNFRYIPSEPSCPSVFVPNQPKLLNPPQMGLAFLPNVLMNKSYGNEPIVDMNRGHNPIQSGASWWTREGPNAANQNAPPANITAQLHDMYAPHSINRRLVPSMDHVAPRNSGLGNPLPIATQSDTFNKNQTTGKEVPINPISHLHDVSRVAPARNRGEYPEAAQAAAQAAYSASSYHDKPFSLEAAEIFAKKIGPHAEVVPVAGAHEVHYKAGSKAVKVERRGGRR